MCIIYIQLQEDVSQRESRWGSAVQTEAEDSEPGEGEPGTVLWPQDDGTDKASAMACRNR